MIVQKESLSTLPQKDMCTPSHAGLPTLTVQLRDVWARCHDSRVISTLCLQGSHSHSSSGLLGPKEAALLTNRSGGSSHDHGLVVQALHSKPTNKMRLNQSVLPSFL